VRTDWTTPALQVHAAVAMSLVSTLSPIRKTWHFTTKFVQQRVLLMNKVCLGQSFGCTAGPGSISLLKYSIFN
jgi:hypothetical protein